MRILNKQFSISQLLCLSLYYSIARYLPVSYSRIGGGLAKRIRYHLCKHIFLSCGKNVNIERLAYFGSGIEIEIGDNSGLGINCVVPSNTKIGNDVMMGPNCYILDANHDFKDINIPMNRQGLQKRGQTIINDDVWIGRNVSMTPGRTIKTGTIVGIGSVLTKDFPEYSIVGGNPARLIKSRR